MRLIDADKLNIDFYEEYETEDDVYAYGYVSKHQIDTAPTIDAVSVVKCKECRYKDMEICPMYRLVVAGVRKHDDFCSYGEREGV